MLANFSVDLGGLCLRDHPPQFRRVAVLACIKNTLPFKYRLILLNANIKPVLEYCVSVGGSMGCSSISWYLKGIKRCERIDLDYPPEVTNLLLFPEHRCLPVNHMCIERRLTYNNNMKRI